MTWSKLFAFLVQRERLLFQVRYLTLKLRVRQRLAGSVVP